MGLLRAGMVPWAAFSPTHGANTSTTTRLTQTHSWGNKRTSAQGPLVQHAWRGQHHLRRTVIAVNEGRYMIIVDGARGRAEACGEPG